MNLRRMLAGTAMLVMIGAGAEAQVKVGLENLLADHLDLIKGKRLGIITNHTSLDARGRHIVDLLSRHTRVTAVFGPEHGFLGDVEDVTGVRDSTYREIPVYSLHGEFSSPTPKMLREVDVLVYDIQDVGVKFYTYISSLFLSMAAAAQAGIPVIVCDRPDPVTASRVEGAITSPAFSSFVGVIPLPSRYGMTVGELAELFNAERFGGFSIGADLTVIPMKGYERGMWYDETGFPWTGTSPNMPTLETAVIYPGMCLLEGTNLSEGRGTDFPFLIVGAPYVDPRKWLEALPDAVLIGVEAVPVTFRPRSIPGKVSKPKYQGKLCQGLRFTVSDRDVFKPIPLTVALLCAAQKLWPAHFAMSTYLDKLWGSEALRAMVTEGSVPNEILATCRAGIERFKSVREKYLIYK
ncbi:MAG: DUF1343 domain-containing protein [Candidatus Aminicenantaceae bacterium]